MARKIVSCPKCGKIFKLPLVDQKFTGLGFNPPYLGVVECPECHNRTGRRKYKLVVQNSEPSISAPVSKSVEPVEPDITSEIEESKYEDE